MRKLLLKKSWALILYILINLYFMVFNWHVFTLKLNINLGPGQIQAPPFVIFFILGMVLLAILSWINYMANLQKIIYDLKQGDKEKMSDKIVIRKVKEQLKDQENVATLKTRLGISEIRSKQDELIGMISKLQEVLNSKNQNTSSMQKK